MTTTSGAYDAIRSVLAAAALPMVFQNEDAQIPTGPLGQPLAFVYVELNVGRAAIVAFGGGRGANVHRNPAVLTLYVFVPRGEGLKSATDKAETLAALFRSYRDASISCFAATVIPGGPGSTIQASGVESEVDNYFWAAVEVEMHFDQIG